MSIETIKIFFISEVNCNWFSVIASKKTGGAMASQTKLNAPVALV